MKYNFPVPRSRGLQNTNCDVFVNDVRACVNDLILHLLLGRIALTDGTTHEIETYFNTDLNVIEIDIPDHVLSTLESLGIGPNLQRYLNWLLTGMDVETSDDTTSGDATSGDTTLGDVILQDVILQDLEFAEGYEKWDDLRVPGTFLRSGVSAPIFEVFRDGVYLLGFVTNQVDEVHATIQLPHQWKEGSNIYPHIHWTHKVAVPSNDQGVVWKLEYTWANVNAVFPQTQTMTAALEWTTSPPAQYKHIITPFSDGVNTYIDGTGKTLSSQLICRLYRDTVDSRDDFASTAYVVELDFHFKVDGLGSDQEYIKD